MIERVAEHEPAIRFGHIRLMRGLSGTDAVLYAEVDAYLGEYLAGQGLSPRDAAVLYMEFAGRYQEDLKRFAKTGRYPAHGGIPQSLDRATYDVFLLVSILTTSHRFRVMAETARVCREEPGPVLVFGAGVGLEVLLAEQAGGRVTAWDRELSPFVRRRFPDAALHTDDFFAAGVDGQYPLVLAVEVLEHFADPEAVLLSLIGAAAPGGAVAVTTARNVPQFDHLHNFTDPPAFERRAVALGLDIEYKRVIPHDYRLMKVDADNVFYRFRRGGRGG